MIELLATPKDLNKYICWKLDTIEEQDWKGSTLLLYYAEDFNNFDTDTFDQAAQTLVQTLRDTL